MKTADELISKARSFEYEVNSRESFEVIKRIDVEDLMQAYADQFKPK